jgi:hypothetical protein
MTIRECYLRLKARPEHAACGEDPFGLTYARMYTALILMTGHLEQAQTDADLDAAMALADELQRKGLIDFFRHLQPCLWRVFSETSGSNQ